MIFFSCLASGKLNVTQVASVLSSRQRVLFSLRKTRITSKRRVATLDNVDTETTTGTAIARPTQTDPKVPIHTAAVMAQVGTKLTDEAVHEVPALIDESVKEPLLDAATAAATAAATGVASTAGIPPAVAAVVPAPIKEDDRVTALGTSEETPLVEVGEAMLAACEVFNRVKSEKIAEQALCSIRNDQAQYEGLAKEIVGKAVKQKERERANRASAAASRAKVLRYQTELESRLNRVEAERNAYRKELQELRSSVDMPKKNSDESSQLAKLQEWIRKMEAANPQFVRSVIAQGEMDKLLGEGEEGKLELEDVKEEGNEAKRRRL